MYMKERQRTVMTSFILSYMEQYERNVLVLEMRMCKFDQRGRRLNTVALLCTRIKYICVFVRATQPYNYVCNGE